MNKFRDLWKGINKGQAGVSSKTFEMIRQKDESGHSGTGKVLDGVVFPCGKTVICWDTANNPDSKLMVTSITVFDSYKDFEAVHIGQHPTNGTIVNWL